MPRHSNNQETYLINTYNNKYNQLGQWTPWNMNEIDAATQVKNWINKSPINKFAGISALTTYNTSGNPDDDVETDTNVYHGFNFDKYTNYNEFGILSERETRELDG